MALTALWKTANKELQEKQVQQVIAFAGDGKLRDGGVASKEFRDFMGFFPLQAVARQCLTAISTLPKKSYQKTYRRFFAFRELA